MRQPAKKEPEHRINRRIVAPMVRVVGESVESQILALKDALRLAEDKGLDLVEISPAANPPVCKIIDYQKFLYEQKRKQKEIKARSAKIVVKEIRLGPQTDDHDFNFKLNHAKKFLSEGSKVKVDVFFRGRTIVYKEQGEVMLLKFAEALLEYGKPESMPKLEGKRMMMMIQPVKATGGNKKAQAPAPEQPAEANN
ncbi:MAG: translation initiation factor IF-3 [Bacteroidales bacterium]|nr:translation initiation factor IF-3 [Bacteroidales bacterium]MDE7357319.1 translation initiation factor IF-3 [Bacteroidales bacterium]